jgi:uroporphyrinogen-III synthase
LSLVGKSVLVTRPKHQTNEVCTNLERLGAQVFLLPALQILPLTDSANLDSALQRLADFDWVVLTSVNGVEAVLARMAELELEPIRLFDRKIAVIGPATAAALAAHGRQPDLVPNEYVAEAIAEDLHKVAGLKFLLARADLARPDLANILRERGGTVEEAAAYRIVESEDPFELPEAAPDYILLTSSAGAEATQRRLTAVGREKWLNESKIMCIGPITAKTVTKMGLPIAAVADEYTMDGLVDCLIRDSEQGAVHV